MKKLFCLGAGALMLCACSEMSNPQISSSEEQKSHSVNVVSSAIISDPAQDPYTVENMSKALRKTALAKSTSAQDSAEVENLSLEANYLYVRFLCEGKEGVRELKNYDPSLVLFKRPMDYKPVDESVVYKDSTLPEGVIPMFASVPADYVFGPTKYEVIKELFLVEPLDGEDEEDSRTLLKKVKGLEKAAVSKINKLGISLQEVAWNSLEMTGNLEERMGEKNESFDEKKKMALSLPGAKKYGGVLKFKEGILGNKPVVGIRVTGGYSYYWREAHTKSDGSFSIPEKWSYSIDYEVHFDSDQFLLEDGHSGVGADLLIAKRSTRETNWTPVFENDQAKWCMVWDAAYQYWYGDNYGLKRPRQNTATNLSLDIEVYYKNSSDYNKVMDKNGIGCNASTSSVGQAGFVGIFDNICILTYQRQLYEIFGTTIHEVAHSSHYWNMKTTNPLMPQAYEFFELDTNYKETYARGIQNYFLEKRYNTTYYNAQYFGNYTGLVEDLRDRDGKTKCGGTGKENISGFDIVSIENAFFQNKHASSMKNYLMNNNPAASNGPVYSKSDMDELYKCWGLIK